VRRLRVLVRLLTLDPSELEAGGAGLGARGGFWFVSLSPPPLRVSALIEPRLSITVCVSSSVSSSSVLVPDAGLWQMRQHQSHPLFLTAEKVLNAIQPHGTAFWWPPPLFLCSRNVILKMGAHDDKKRTGVTNGCVSHLEEPPW
jgi:hypothetical protein